MNDVDSMPTFVYTFKTVSPSDITTAYIARTLARCRKNDLAAIGTEIPYSST